MKGTNRIFLILTVILSLVCASGCAKKDDDDSSSSSQSGFFPRLGI